MPEGRRSAGDPHDAASRPDIEQRGRRKQVKADLKNAGEQVKDAAGKTKRAFKH